jgi:hypothetical protein
MFDESELATLKNSLMVQQNPAVCQAILFVVLEREVQLQLQRTALQRKEQALAMTERMLETKRNTHALEAQILNSQLQPGTIYINIHV